MGFDDTNNPQGRKGNELLLVYSSLRADSSRKLRDADVKETEAKHPNQSWLFYVLSHTQKAHPTALWYPASFFQLRNWMYVIEPPAGV